MRMTAAAILLLSLPAAIAVPTMASAGCFEHLGCTDDRTFSLAELRRLSCQNLWYVRNSIYDDNGYCFKTAAAQAVFDNTGCWVTDAAKVQLNRHERANISRIVRVEKEKGCRAR